MRLEARLSERRVGSVAAAKPRRVFVDAGLFITTAVAARSEGQEERDHDEQRRETTHQLLVDAKRARTLPGKAFSRDKRSERPARARRKILPAQWEWIQQREFRCL